MWMLKEADNLLFGEPKNRTKTNLRDDSGNLVCISGYNRHNPIIRNFAMQSPENFAQVMLFSPLSANTTFSDLFETFPVLMSWLRNQDKITVEDVSSFILGLQTHAGNRKKQISKVIGETKAWKLNTIVEIWNNRERYYQEARKLNDSDDMVGLLGLLSKIPGVQPVKAGFITQLLFGKMGCLDTHNIDMYRALSAKMGWGLEDELSDNAVKNWGTKGEEGVKAYVDLLKKMDQDLGIGSPELWDLWCDLVGELYSKSRGEEVYNADFGPTLNPDDPSWEKKGGGQIWTKNTSGGRKIKMTVAGGSPEGMAASKVHLMGAVDPQELIRQFRKGNFGDDHLINSIARDRDMVPLLIHYADILNSPAAMKSALDKGAGMVGHEKTVQAGKKILYDRLIQKGWTAAAANDGVKELTSVLKKRPHAASMVHVGQPLFGQ